MTWGCFRGALESWDCHFGGSSWASLNMVGMAGDVSNWGKEGRGEREKGVLGNWRGVV